MVDDVSVKFGADIAGLDTAMKGAKDAVQGFTQSVQPAFNQLTESTKLNHNQMVQLTADVHHMIDGLIAGIDPMRMMVIEGVKLSTAFGEMGLGGTLKAVGGSIVGFLSNPITLAMLAFGGATEAARKLFEVIGAGGSAAEAALKSNKELTAQIAHDFDAAGEAAQRLFLISLAQQRNELRAQIDETKKVMESSLRAALLPLSQLEGAYGLNSPLFKLIEDFSASVKSGTANVGQFNDVLSTLIENAAKIDPHPEQIRSFGKELIGTIQPAIDLNASLGKLTSTLADLEGNATADQKAISGLKNEVASLDQMLAEKAAAWQALHGVFNRFDFAGKFDKKDANADEKAAARELAAEQKTAYEQEVADAKKFQAEVRAEIKATSAAWESMFTTIVGGFDKAISGLIRRTMTWKQATFEVLGTVWDEFVKVVEKMIVKWLAMESANTMATILGTKTRQGAEEAAAAAGLAKELSAAVASIKIAAEKTYANVFAFLSPFMGPLAAVPAGASALVVGAAAAALPSFAMGSWELPSDMIAQVHKGEMIVPAAQAEQVRQGGGMSGSDIDRLVNKLVPHLRASANASRAMQRNVDSRLRTLRGAT